jgi:hypothetical protein
MEQWWLKLSSQKRSVSTFFGILRFMLYLRGRNLASAGEREVQKHEHCIILCQDWRGWGWAVEAGGAKMCDN